MENVDDSKAPVPSQRSASDPGANVADVTDDALEDSDGLAWASSGLWTDISVHSTPDSVPLTILTLRKTLDNEHKTQSSMLIWIRSGLITLSVTVSGTIAASIAFAKVQADGSKSVLLLVSTCLLGISAITFGALSSARRGIRREKLDIDLTQNVLRHEMRYHDQLAETSRLHDA